MVDHVRVTLVSVNNKRLPVPDVSKEVKQFVEKFEIWLDQFDEKSLESPIGDP